MCSITGFANKIGAAFGTFLIGVLMTASGFDGTLATQPDSAIMMIRVCYAFLLNLFITCYAIVPVLFYLLGAFALKFYKLDNMKKQMNEDLEERRKKLEQAE